MGKFTQNFSFEDMHSGMSEKRNDQKWRIVFNFRQRAKTTKRRPRKKVVITLVS